MYIQKRQYMKQLLDNFNMHEAKYVNTRCAALKLSTKSSPTTETEKVEMKNIPYVLTIGSLMYAMICTRLRVTYALVLILNQYRERTLVSSKRNTAISLGGGEPKKLFVLWQGKLVLEGYTEANVVSDTDFRKPTSRYMTTFSTLVIEA